MTSILSNSFILKSSTVFLLAVLFLLPLQTAVAQGALALSVTPTLFEMSANPGQEWRSSVKVINSNDFDLTIYPSVVNFAPQGESGQGKFLPVFEEVTDGTTLAEWVELSETEVTIPPEQSREVEFVVRVPEDASPGGHFAAILISTRPPANDEDKFSVRTAQIVTSLFFVRLAGDVVESGSIRSFALTDSFLASPDAEFELRFENKGNVHLQPRGDITIYNMWGKERGSIPINHRTHFGNVLPNSIRSFNFSWSGDASFLDIGRYKAVASLAYGIGNTQYTTSASYFWVVPIKSLALTLLGILIVIFIISRAIKLYVRHMLAMAGVSPEFHRRKLQRVRETNDVEVGSFRTITAPMRSGVADLQDRLSERATTGGLLRTLWQFFLSYKTFFLLAVLMLLVVGVVSWYIISVTTDTAEYEVTINNPGTETNLNAEEAIFATLSNQAALSAEDSLGEQAFTLSVTNTSGKAGTAAYTALSLIEKQFLVTDLSTDTNRQDKNTVIIYDQEVTEAAVQLSKSLGGALLSARVASSSTAVPNITVYVGKDRRIE